MTIVPFFFVCRYVMLLSGLNVGSPWCNQLAIQMMVDYASGQLCGPQVRVCVCTVMCHIHTKEKLDHRMSEKENATFARRTIHEKHSKFSNQSPAKLQKEIFVSQKNSGPTYKFARKPVH